MNATLWGFIATVLVAAAGLTGAIITAKTSGRVSPYAELAKRVTDLEHAHDNDRKTIELLQTDLSSQNRKVGAVISDRDDVVAYLMLFREWVANGSNPPAPKIPMHLKDVIPDWTPDDEDRSTDVHVRSSGSYPDSFGP